MLVNQETLAVAFKGFNTVFTDAYMSAPAHAEKIAMKVPSSGATETYGWLGSFPAMREWVGPRQIKNLEAHGFVIKNRKFEATLAVGRDAYADDKLGLFGPMFAEMGQGARRHPEELTFGLLKAGFDTECYDEKKFFDAAHPVTDAAGKVKTVSNVQEGTGPAWFLLDTSRALRPLILQVREGYEFQEIAAGNSSHVFMNDEYLYGVRARVNAGFGLWQLAFGSKAALDGSNYAAARAAMMGFKSDGGRILGVNPTALVVPPELEEAALHLLNTETKDGGGSNPWKGTAEVIVTPYLA